MSVAAPCQPQSHMRMYTTLTGQHTFRHISHTNGHLSNGEPFTEIYGHLSNREPFTEIYGHLSNGEPVNEIYSHLSNGEPFTEMTVHSKHPWSLSFVTFYLYRYRLGLRLGKHSREERGSLQLVCFSLVHRASLLHPAHCLLPPADPHTGAGSHRACCTGLCHGLAGSVL